MNKSELSKYIDQTLLKAVTTEEEIVNFCNQAKDYGFASVCVNQNYVSVAHDILMLSDTKVCTVIDFPLGAAGKDVKIKQAALAITSGADELDFVVNLGLVKAHKWDKLQQELTEVIAGTKEAAMISSTVVLTKLIIETCYLDNDEIVETCKCAVEAGFDFVKTSTGFGTGGATTEHVSLMKQTVADAAKVKASGGIKTLDDALKMIEAGASRLGTSCGVQIVDAVTEEQ